MRLCTVPDIMAVDEDEYQELRTDIIQYCMNALDSHNESDFMTEQLFDILMGITKKCYLMYSPRAFFDELMSPFVFLPLLEFTFEGGAHTRQGAEFFKLFFYNMFVAEPNAAVLDVLDFNFGFEAVSYSDSARFVVTRMTVPEPNA